MRFRDAYRAQYFIEILEDEVKRFIEIFNDQDIFSKSTLELIDEFATQIAVEVDQIILPSIAHEIKKTSSSHSLSGNSSSLRYENFFVKNHKYTLHARLFLDHYPFLFELINTFIKSSFNNLHNCIKRLFADWQQIQNYFLLDK